jgi:hypothetical protein
MLDCAQKHRTKKKAHDAGGSIMRLEIVLLDV